VVSASTTLSISAFAKSERGMTQYSSRIEWNIEIEIQLPHFIDVW